MNTWTIHSILHAAMEEQDPLLGRVIGGKLKLLDLLGSGAMGKVYRAHHEGLDKTVAIKVLHQKEGAGSQLARRFKAEARAASRLDHPNSLRILDFGEDGPDGLLYIAMEFLDGEDLSAVLRREGRLDSQRTAMIMSQTLAALSVAHQQGVVHRDMKPGNIMLLPRATEQGVVRDVVKVCDFGLAKVLDAPADDASGAPLTKQGAILGTPAYMSPEQASGEPTDQATDIYSCGVILYVMLTGRPPFTAESATGLLMKHILEEPVPLTSLVPDVDPRLAAVAHRAMAKKKEQRFASAREMLNALREIVHEASGLDLPPIARSSSLRGASVASAVPAPASGERSDPFAKTFVRSDERAAAAAASAASKSEVKTPMPMATAAPSVAPVVPAAGGSRSTLIIAVVGSIALFLAGVVAALVIPGQRDSGSSSTPLPIEQPAQAPAQHAPVEPTKPVVAMVDEKKPSEEMPAVEEMKDPTPTPAKTKKPPAKEKTKPPVEEKKPAETTPPVVVEQPKVEQPKVEEKPPVIEEKPPVVEQPRVIEEPKVLPEKKPPVILDQKPRDEHAQTVEATLTGLEIITGGISRTRTMEALEKQMPVAKKCLEKFLLPGSAKKDGEIKVGGKIDSYGKFSDVKASSGAGEKIDSCVGTAMQAARFKSSDTGDARISMIIRYRLF